MTQMDMDEAKPRSLVLCFDGTSNKYDAENTNAVKIFALLKKDDDDQLTFYQPGIGTWFGPGIVSPVFEWAAKILDLAFAWYLDAHVIEGYAFLMENYQVGDKICIFGFSRGAYTARALAGLLYKVGLLPRDNTSQVSFAYEMYKRTDAEGIRLCAGFKQTYCRAVTVEFMGVWDTVSGVGFFRSPTLPFTNSNSAIKTFRHALSLDEHRTKFRPNYYHRIVPSPGTTQVDPENASPVKTSGGSLVLVPYEPEPESGQVEKKKRKTWSLFTRGSTARENRTRQYVYCDAVEMGEPDDVLEVWFTGCHSDIGGGSVSNDVEQSLSNITLRWMVRQAITSGCGVIFDGSALSRAKIDFEPEPTPSEIELDSTDALEPLHDELRSNVLWWLLEIFPFGYSWQDANCVWHRTYKPNMGSGRQIVGPHPKFHTTVKERIESQLGYKPKAKWTPGSEVYLH